MKVNIQDAVYEGVWHSQTLVPQFRLPDTLGDSLSSSLTGPPETAHMVLEINERLLAGESSRLARRLNEAYQDDELEPEEREFLNLAAELFGRRLSGEQ